MPSVLFQLCPSAWYGKAPTDLKVKLISFPCRQQGQAQRERLQALRRAVLHCVVAMAHLNSQISLKSSCMLWPSACDDVRHVNGDHGDHVLREPQTHHAWVDEGHGQGHTQEGLHVGITHLDQVCL